jgi:hypothetical protein
MTSAYQNYRQQTAPPDGDGDTAKRGRKRSRKADAGGDKASQADRLVALACGAGCDFFHTPGGLDSEGYVTVPAGDHRETWPVTSKGFRRWLAALYYRETKKAPGSQALQDALQVLAGKAVHGEQERPVAARLAEHGGAIYLDLADAGWRVVRVTAGGWALCDDCAVRFLRPRGMLPLPMPVPGGSVDELRPLVNLGDDASWILFLAWLVAAFRPDRPFCILALNGEQGSAKSTLSRMGRGLIDPNVAPLRRPPRDPRDLMIAARNSWLVAFDNLSNLPGDLSDTLCCLATGGGFGTRELYSDFEEILFDAKRPCSSTALRTSPTGPTYSTGPSV